jgi:predicted RNA binding protein YcfA (HicA-like mRNA interferase family)
MSAKAVIRRLEELGFSQTRQRGSHIILKKQTPVGDIGCVVPLHKELAVGTLRGILKQAKLSVEEFTKPKS